MQNFSAYDTRLEKRYVGGQWIDSRTRAVVTSANFRNTGVKRVMNDYSTLNGIADYNPVTSAINGAVNNINLFSSGGPGTGGSESNTPKYFADLARGIANPDIDVYSKKSDVFDRTLYEGNQQHNVPSYVRLGHELGHVWDILNQTPRRNNFVQIPGLSPGISNSEANAMYWENVLRVHANLPLRLFYNNNGTRLEYPANVIIGPVTIRGGRLDRATNTILPLEIGTPILLQGLGGAPSSNYFRKIFR